MYETNARITFETICPMDEAQTAARRLGETLKVALANAGLSITDMHKRTGISRQTIYRMLDGDTLPSLDVLIRLAAELNVSAGALLDGQVKPLRGRPATEAIPPLVSQKFSELEERLRRLETSDP